MLPTRPLLALGLVLSAASSSPAQFSSTKVAETGFNYPGFGTLTALVVRPSLSGGTVAFGGNFATGPVLARASSGTITAIATNTTAVPEGSGNFVAFNAGPIGLSGSVYTFAGNGNPPVPANAGAYSNVTGSLTPVVRLGMPYPTGGSFTNFSPAAVSGTTFAFWGTNNPFAPVPLGVFTRTGSTVAVVANTTTAVPTGSGNFIDFTVPLNGPFIPVLPNISGSNVVFGGQGGGRFGLFLSNAGALSAVATNATAIPNGTGTFTSFGGVPAISGSNIAFFAAGSSGQQGIYRWSGGAPVLIANRTTAVPGAGAGVTFNSFLHTDVAISGDRVAFLGTSTTGVNGIYTDLTGSLMKVVATGDILDGRTVSAVNIGQFAFSGDSIAVMVGFTNGSAGVYTFAPVPEPTGLLALGAVGLLAARVCKRRAARKPPVDVSVL